jgi:3-dehydro-L-gulonate-6-phosphate decarboxylase
MNTSTSTQAATRRCDLKVPRLQLALDTTDLNSALGPLQKSASWVDVIEVGTILCLAEGMHAVRTIRTLFPDKTILADVRIAEAGSLISKLAFEAGADWVSVVSGATLTSVEAVVSEARKHNGDVQIELFDGWTLEDARNWRELGIGQVITHRSRDAEARGELTWSEKDFDEIRGLADMGFKVTVTGGIGLEDIHLFAGVPVFVFIVGRGIYKAEDPALAAKSFREAIESTFRR